MKYRISIPVKLIAIFEVKADNADAAIDLLYEGCIETPDGIQLAEKWDLERAKAWGPQACDETIFWGREVRDGRKWVDLGTQDEEPVS